MDSLSQWFEDTDKAISESKYIPRGLFWKTAAKVFSGELTPEKGAEMIEKGTIENITESIAGELMDKIAEELTNKIEEGVI